MYRFSLITEQEAIEVLHWRYDDLTVMLQPVEQNYEEDLAALMLPEYNYYAVRDAADELVGFCCYGEDAQVVGGDYTAPALDVGMGLRPDLVGQGRAQGFLQAVLDWGSLHFAPEMFRCTVAAANPRSQRMFARAGFMAVQRFAASSVIDLDFIVMVRVAEAVTTQAPPPA
jgi:RimJ/RimL family protein N-acetyltransferase